MSPNLCQNQLFSDEFFDYVARALFRADAAADAELAVDCGEVVLDADRELRAVLGADPAGDAAGFADRVLLLRGSLAAAGDTDDRRGGNHFDQTARAD